MRTYECQGVANLKATAVNTEAAIAGPSRKVDLLFAIVRCEQVNHVRWTPHSLSGHRSEAVVNNNRQSRNQGA
jgi:hypothetical protein